MTTPRPYLDSSLPIVTRLTGRSVWFGAYRLSGPLTTFDDQSPAVGQRRRPAIWAVGVDVPPQLRYHRTDMDTQLSKIETTFAAQPPCPIARFRTNGSHTLVPGDGCAGESLPDCQVREAQPQLNLAVRSLT